MELKEWVSLVGPRVVAEKMQVRPATVYNWLNYKNHPSPQMASKLIEVSLGVLSWESIYKPFVEHNDGIQLEFKLQ